MKLITALFALLVVALPAWAEDAPMAIDGATTVDADGVIELIQNNGDLVILDSRKPQDYAAGHIEGAVRLINTDTTPEALAEHIPSKDTAVLIYCNGVKCGRAADSVQRALDAGYGNVYYYALGMTEWNDKGLPVVTE